MNPNVYITMPITVADKFYRKIRVLRSEHALKVLNLPRREADNPTYKREGDKLDALLSLAHVLSCLLQGKASASQWASPGPRGLTKVR